MDFFEHQERARKRTVGLVLLFAIAVVLVVVAVYAAVVVGLMVGHFFQPDMDALQVDAFWQWRRFYGVASLTSLVLLVGSLYKIHQLKQGGGAAVAEQLGGVLLRPNAADGMDRRLLNVVEEMAIASGLPVPPVYVLEQSGINAFAAGFSSSDTVIGVTRGAMSLLSRDELQGVMAHEFSHILHGDTRMNMRMMGWLHGMTLISDLGMLLLTARRSSHYSRTQRSSHPALLVLGALVFLVGVIGLIAADLIKRAVSRQREFLADASAVKFTRNPLGIANALKTMGGYKQGSRVEHADAGSLGYFFFGYAVKAEAHGQKDGRDWWATHPPLLERIQRIEPSFRGRIQLLDVSEKRRHVQLEVSAGTRLVEADGAYPKLNQAMLMGAFGQLQANALAGVAHALDQIPKRLRDFTHDPYTARALCYGVLLSGSEGIRKKQWALLEKKAEGNVLRELLDIQAELQLLPSSLRLPLIEMMLPALKQLSMVQYQNFVQNIQMLVKADHQISMFEYALHRMLLHHLAPAFSEVQPPILRYHHVKEVAGASASVLALLIGFGAHAEPEVLFQRMTEELLGEAMPWPPSRLLQMSQLDLALKQLVQAAPMVKKAVLEKCVVVILADGILHEQELEALRALADGMDCPMPMLTPMLQGWAEK